MQPMKFFVDTHDQRKQTFPRGITKEQFAEFFAGYEKAAREHGVVVLRVHVGFEEGRAFCFNMAKSAEDVRKVHEAVGLPYDEITEVTTATPGDLFFRPQG
jgi:xanthine dehydrogenase iron-sulfur cluster and FAD-binding subunit A